MQGKSEHGVREVVFLERNKIWNTDDGEPKPITSRPQMQYHDMMFDLPQDVGSASLDQVPITSRFYRTRSSFPDPQRYAIQILLFDTAKLYQSSALSKQSQLLHRYIWQHSHTRQFSVGGAVWSRYEILSFQERGRAILLHQED